MEITADANGVIQELREMLSQAQFQLAVAGARIVQQERTIEGMKKSLAAAAAKPAEQQALKSV